MDDSEEYVIGKSEELNKKDPQVRVPSLLLPTSMAVNKFHNHSETMQMPSDGKLVGSKMATTSTNFNSKNILNSRSVSFLQSQKPFNSLVVDHQN